MKKTLRINVSNKAIIDTAINNQQSTDFLNHIESFVIKVKTPTETINITPDCSIFVEFILDEIYSETFSENKTNKLNTLTELQSTNNTKLEGRFYEDSTDELSDVIIKLTKKHLMNCENNTISLETTLEQLELDSIDCLEFIMGIEDNLKITLENDIFSNAKTLKDIYIVLKQMMNEL
jgi:acyl carrier protein